MSRWVVVWIVVAAVGLRLVALARTPPLSTDVWRYLWDGRVTNAGINPFQYAPNAPEVEHLRDENWRSINFKHVSTIYPPAAEMLFACLARMRPSDAKAFSWTFALFDIGNVLLLMALLRRTGRRPERALTEVTAGSHVDPFAVFFLLMAFLFTDDEGRPGVGSGLAMAASVMGKGYAVLALPFFLSRGRLRFLLPFVLLCAALVVPYAGAGGQLFGGLREYASAWETNASVLVCTMAAAGTVLASIAGARIVHTHGVGAVLRAVALPR
jgi:hypothetical protein